MPQVLFEMCPATRALLIEKHQFYVAEARKRLLDQFTDAALENEADQAARDSFEARGKYCDPNNYDPSDYAHEAYEDGIWRYELLTDLRNNVRLSILSGVFHQWEKSLRQWLVEEFRNWHHGNALRAELWKKNVSDLVDLLEALGWSLKASSYFKNLDACRLVVNVYKHGDGPSLDDLAKDYPQFLDLPLKTVSDDFANIPYSPSHEDLKITDSDLDVFAEAISSFWADIPSKVFDDQVAELPKWFQKAFEKDRQQSRQQT